jgi:hypothetical protein
MLGAWCKQPDAAQVEEPEAENLHILRDTPMKRCAPGSPDATTMTRRAMDSEHDHCRIVSVTTRSATRWLVEHVCDSRPGRRYGWTFFRDGELLYLAQVGTFTFTGEENEPRRAGHDAPGCYSRVYDKAHLAKHPDQLVTSMRLLVTDDDGFALRVTLRGRDDALYTQGWYSQKPYGLLCRGWPGVRPGKITDPIRSVGRVATDGGSVRISSRGRGTVMLHLDDRIQILAEGHEPEWLSSGKDDDVLRLDRADRRACGEMQPRVGEH